MSNEGDDVKAATYHSSYAELRFITASLDIYVVNELKAPFVI